MKKRYRSWATLISALSLSFLMAQGSNADSTISYKYDKPNIIKYEDYKPLLFLEHGAMRSDIQLAAHRSHSSHRSHASHASHASGSYSAPAPRTYSPPSTPSPEPTPKTYSQPSTITPNSSSDVPQSNSNKVYSNSPSASTPPSKSINSLIVSKPKYSIKLKSGATWRANLTSKVDDKVELTLEDGMTVWVRSADISQIFDSQSGAIIYP